MVGLHSVLLHLSESDHKLWGKGWGGFWSGIAISMCARARGRAGVNLSAGVGCTASISRSFRAAKMMVLKHTTSGSGISALSRRSAVLQALSSPDLRWHKTRNGGRPERLIEDVVGRRKEWRVGEGGGKRKRACLGRGGSAANQGAERRAVSMACHSKTLEGDGVGRPWLREGRMCKKELRCKKKSQGHGLPR